MRQLLRQLLTKNYQCLSYFVAFNGYQRFKQQITYPTMIGLSMYCKHYYRLPVLLFGQLKTTYTLMDMDLNDNIIDNLSTKFCTVIAFTTHGTGCLVEYQNSLFVITNEHVVKDLWHTIILCNNSGGERRYGRILSTDHTMDLALIWFPTQGLPVQPFTIAQSVEFGDEMLTLGFGHRYPTYDMGAGIVTCPDSTTYTNRPDVLYNSQPITMIESTATQRGGFSGGPLVNQNGQLAGILCMSAMDGLLHYSTPAYCIERFIKGALFFDDQEWQRRDAEHGLRLGLCLRWNHQLMGCQIVDKFEETFENNNLNVDNVIIEINGQPLPSLDSFIVELTKYDSFTDIPVLIAGDFYHRIIRNPRINKSFL
ncbi:probable periplasmic serine endoprotease DegP-like [Oppia nitens]|uniref:probable periplasmic serine endoprotease DegP-like n=1 Tax=Oppia nitens TaxID=1686743 RepID=UPI0023DC71DC|nr:probable periplasmic serine endoprotease DegP-like [Oppia nitens]